MREIKISTDYIKLDSFLKFAGEAAAGSDAKELILQGKVAVDGETCLKRGKKLQRGSIVCIQEREYKVI